MLTTQHHPKRDTVLYDGACNFCRGQIGLLRRLDLAGRLAFTSLHDPSVGRDFPEISHDDLLSQMYVISREGEARGGAEAVRYLSRTLPALWPLAVPMHIPGSLGLWQRLYAFVARHRMQIAGRCADGSCRLPE